MLTLDNLLTIRVKRGYGRYDLSRVTGISTDRIRDLETGQKRREPWLSEAFILHRTLGTPGITPMINGQDVLTGSDGLDFGLSLPTDVAMYRSGARLPLSLACRVALKLGLPDPAYLYQPDPLLLQVWDILERNERGAPAGVCPWCLVDRAAGQDHLETCLPANLWSPVRHDMRPIGPLPKVDVMGARQGSSHAKGLRLMRERAGLTQKQLAEAIRTNPSYLARVERGECSLTRKKAEALALLLRCDMPDLYRQHEEQEA